MVFKKNKPSKTATESAKRRAKPNEKPARPPRSILFYAFRPRCGFANADKCMLSEFIIDSDTEHFIGTVEHIFTGNFSSVIIGRFFGVRIVFRPEVSNIQFHVSH